MPQEVPASIRTNDPGAMWGKHNAIAQKWGAKQTIGLNDGLGQGNNIAVFPTKVQGAAAQFDLWKNHYVGLSLTTAITKWCGGNSPAAYVKFICDKTGIHPLDQVTPYLLSGPQGLALMKAQAAWECGRITEGYPMTDAEWDHAQALVFGRTLQQPAPPVPPTPSKPIETSAPAKPPSVIGAIISAILSIFKRKA